MSTVDGNRWTYTMNGRKTGRTAVLQYFSSVDCEGSERRHEWSTECHTLDLNLIKATEYQVFNRWRDIPEDTYLYSSAFTECVNHRKGAVINPTAFAKTVRLIVRAPQLRAGDRLAICGESDALGGWDVAKAVPMYEHNFNEWMVDLNADGFEEGSLAFKFVALNTADKANPLWETGLNRTVDVVSLKDGEAAVYDLEQAFFEICDRKLAGTLVPVFSLRSKTSFGVGDFGDLKKMVDWVALTHQRVLQVLPINDTTITHTWTDSYPYSCISIFALHPQYVDLTRLPALKDAKKRNDFEALRQQLNALKQIDYEQVNNAKTTYLKELFAQEGKKMMKSAAFKAFFKESEQWLVPYAQYCYLRDVHGTADFSRWPDHPAWNEADREALTTASTEAYGQVEFYYFVQFILNTQMEAVHEYARSKGVILRGPRRGRPRPPPAPACRRRSCRPARQPRR